MPEYKDQELFGEQPLTNYGLMIPAGAMPEEAVLRWQTRYHREYLDKHLKFFANEKLEQGTQIELPLK